MYINKKSVLARQATAYDPNPDIANEQEQTFIKAIQNDDFAHPKIEDERVSAIGKRT